MLSLVEWAEPVGQALVHALAASLDLSGQRRFDVFFLTLAHILGEGLLHLIDLLIVHPTQQFDRRRRDLPSGPGDGLLGFQGPGLQGGIGDLAGDDHLSGAGEPVQVVGQLRCTVPLQVLLKTFFEPVLLLAIHVQVVVERPGNDRVEVAVGQVHAVAGRQGKAQGQQQTQVFQPARHGPILAQALFWYLNAGWTRAFNQSIEPVFGLEGE
ncbi:hypothetical protein D3C78_924790 [compost metagenome]